MKSCNNSITKAMLMVVSRQIESGGVNLFPGPTGIGKSYSARETIVRLWQMGYRVVFITSQKSIVDSTYTKMLKKDAKAILDTDEYEKFKDDVVRLYNFYEAWESLLSSGKHCSEIKADIGKTIASSSDNSRLAPLFDELKEAFDSYDRYLKSGGRETDSIAAVFMQGFLDHERIFRRNLKKAIETAKRTGVLDYFLKENKWIEKAYPWVRGKNKKVVITTAAKFRLPADDLQGRNEALYIQLTDLAGANNKCVYIVDEIDKVKEDLRGYIIEGRESYDPLRLAYSLCRSCTEENLQRAVYEFSGLTRLSEKPREMEMLRAFIKRGEELKADYNIHSLLREFSRNSQSSLMTGGNVILESSYSSMVNSSKNIFFKAGKDDILYLSSKKEEGYQPFTGLLDDVRAYINMFIAMAPALLHSYAENEDAYAFDDTVISSFLKLCVGMYDDGLYFLKEAIKMRKYVGMSGGARNFYESGFSLVSPLRDDADRSQNIVRASGVSQTPEMILLHIARRGLVLGLSATGDIPSVLSNFNFSWLASRGIPVTYPVEAELELIKERQRLRFKHLHKVKLYAGAYGDRDGEDLRKNEYIISKIAEVAPSCESNQSALKEAQAELMEIACAFDAFLLGNHYAGLAITASSYCQNTQGHAKYVALSRVLRSVIAVRYIAIKNPGMDPLSHDAEQLVDEFIKGEGFLYKTVSVQGGDLVCPAVGVTASFLTAVTEEYNKAFLKNANTRLFLLAANKSAGTGLNLNAQVTDVSELVKIGDFIDDKAVDFDFLFIGNKTNIFSSTDKDTRKGSMTLIYEILDVYEDGQISTKEKWAALSSCLGGYSYRKEKQIQLLAFHYDILRYIVQITGRLDRSAYKRKSTEVIIDSRLLKIFNYIVAEEYLGDERRVMNPLTRVVLEAMRDLCRKMPVMTHGLENRCTLIANRSGAAINAMFRISASNPATIRKMQMRRKMSAFVLKHPRPLSDMSDFKGSCSSVFAEGETPETANKVDFMDLVDHFLNTEGKEPVIKRNDGDYENVEVHFEMVVKPTFISELGSGLTDLMKNPVVKKGFEELGYATSWGSDGLYMTPAMYNNIYKGAIGEEAEKIVLGKILGYDISEYYDVKSNEKMDFGCAGVPVDSKNYSCAVSKDDEERDAYRQSLAWKIDQLDKDCGMVINVLGEENRYRLKEEVLSGYGDIPDKTVLFVPALIDRETGEFIHSSIEAIRRFVDEHGMRKQA